MDSMEFRWVFQDQDSSEIENGEDDDDNDDDVGFLSPTNGMDSDDDDNAEQRLIRTGPRIDSFDVEALEVPGAQRIEFEVSEFLFIFLQLRMIVLVMLKMVAWTTTLDFLGIFQFAIADVKSPLL